MERLRRSPRSGLALNRAAASDTGVDVTPGLGVGDAGDGFVGGAGADTGVGGGGSTWSGISFSPGSGEINYGETAGAAATAAAAAARMMEKMTGRSSGGPQTAVGYLLGELRMRPEEVGRLAGIGGKSGDAFRPYPVRATAACAYTFIVPCEALCI